MKKLFPLILCLLPLAGCMKDGTYTEENANGIVTVYEGKLYSDQGLELTIVEDKTSGSEEWKKDGTRCYAIFDILNRNLDIRLTFIEPLQAFVPEPFDEEEEVPTDPVSLVFAQLGYQHLDIGLQVYKASSSTYPHTLLYRYTLDESAGILHLYLYHDGNGEDPSKMDEKNLTKENRLLTLPLEGYGDIQDFDLTTYVLINNPDGGKPLVQSYVFRSYQVGF